MKLLLTRREVDAAVRIHFNLSSDAIIETDEKLEAFTEIQKFQEIVDKMIVGDRGHFNAAVFLEGWEKLCKHIEAKKTLPRGIYFRNNTIILEP